MIEAKDGERPASGTLLLSFGINTKRVIDLSGDLAEEAIHSQQNRLKKGLGIETRPENSIDRDDGSLIWSQKLCQYSIILFPLRLISLFLPTQGLA